MVPALRRRTEQTRLEEKDLFNINAIELLFPPTNPEQGIESDKHQTISHDCQS